IAKGLREAYMQLDKKEFEQKDSNGKIKRDAQETEIKISGNFCPECGGVLMFVEGCQKCNCGYSKC
ncbi:hypothetical protein KJ962_03650, partial [Patescibacteria group bacterium]|nr:hypothetical protein [Patescibacteria group bacterium]